MLILIIEDDPGISELLSRKLQETGFETENLQSGAEAVSYLEARVRELGAAIEEVAEGDGLAPPP